MQEPREGKGKKLAALHQQLEESGEAGKMIQAE